MVSPELGARGAIRAGLTLAGRGAVSIRAPARGRSYLTRRHAYKPQFQPAPARRPAVVADTQIA